MTRDTRNPSKIWINTKIHGITHVHLLSLSLSFHLTSSHTYFLSVCTQDSRDIEQKLKMPLDRYSNTIFLREKIPLTHERTEYPFSSPASSLSLSLSFRLDVCVSLSLSLEFLTLFVLSWFQVITDSCRVYLNNTLYLWDITNKTLIITYISLLLTTIEEDTGHLSPSLTSSIFWGEHW
jgi:hypothetical protein